jgi:hypothetical protein
MWEVFFTACVFFSFLSDIAPVSSIQDTPCFSNAAVALAFMTKTQSILNGYTMVTRGVTFSQVVWLIGC